MSGQDGPGSQPPSGHQYVIADGPSRAHISTVGATLRSYSVDGYDVIDGFRRSERATDGRGQVLAPWPNRLTDGSYRYGGLDCQAALNELSRHDAIHGLVRWLDWTLEAHDPTSVALSCAVRPQPGYEWHLELNISYRLGPTGMTVTFRATNVGVDRAPFGLGFHPYLTIGPGSIDRLQLTLPAAGYLDPAELAGTGNPSQHRLMTSPSLGRSGRPAWTPPSRTWCGAPTGVPSPGSTTPTTAASSSSGSMAASAT